MAKSAKGRLDQTLVARGLAESRNQAQALIMAGKVFAGETRLDKAGQAIFEDLEITVRGEIHPWVSRGGQKLAHGLSYFDVDPYDAIAVDIGASTGGFTDVLLSYGAARVYAVDVGHGQLAWKLRQDDRVVVLEKTNARHLDQDLIPDPANFIVCDASFIGLQTVLPSALALAACDAVLIALIKPQFEVGRRQVGKGGVVRDPKLHEQVCTRISDWLRALPGWSVMGISESPITGSEGNKEFLIGAQRNANNEI
jgi:23S rRNA (cytidine1920-2'-O)/16S rRNA (cytidine1409-2'-O)-methyltransferase